MVQFNSIFTTIHALAIVALGTYWALIDRTTQRAILILFYITGAELLWRGFKADVFWEYGKYSIILILLILIWRFGLSRLSSKIGFLLVLFLLPSFIMLPEFNRQDISHSISGPVTLGLAVTIFSNHIIKMEQLKTYLLSLLLPIISLFSLMLLSTIQHGRIDIYAAYINEYTTAGIGPNQASNIVGLGVFICYLLYFLDKQNKRTYLIFGLGMLFQAIVTHSRGGFWNAIIAVSIGLIFLINNANQHLKFIMSIIFTSLILYFVAFPIIDDASGGSLSSRYMDTNLSQREKIIDSEMDAFRSSPLFGIGPGMSLKYRMTYYDSRKHTHTEYTRLFSEHGLFGIGFIIILIYLSWRIFKTNYGVSRSIAISMVAWSLLFMFHSATRLAAPAIIFGLATAQFRLDED